MIEFKSTYLLGNKARQIVLELLQYAAIKTPDFLRPIVQPIYWQVTKIPLFRRIVWGSTSRDRCIAYWTDPIDGGNKADNLPRWWNDKQHLYAGLH